MDGKQQQACIAAIAALPAQIRALTDGMSAAQLTAHPLKGEWSVAQNVHHLADAHISSYVRCHMVALDPKPPLAAGSILQPYEQNAWAATREASSANIAVSLDLLVALHARWVTFFNERADADWARTGVHLIMGRVTLAGFLKIYADHGAAHIDQIARTKAALKGKPKPKARPRRAG